jgi:hypothetical protein
VRWRRSRPLFRGKLFSLQTGRWLVRAGSARNSTLSRGCGESGPEIFRFGAGQGNIIVESRGQIGRIVISSMARNHVVVACILDSL